MKKKEKETQHYGTVNFEKRRYPRANAVIAVVQPLSKTILASTATA